MAWLLASSRWLLAPPALMVRPATLSEGSLPRGSRFTPKTCHSRPRGHGGKGICFSPAPLQIAISRPENLFIIARAERARFYRREQETKEGRGIGGSCLSDDRVEPMRNLPFPT